MSPGSSTESYPAFAHIELRENPGKNLNQVTFPDRESNPGHLVSRPDALTDNRCRHCHNDVETLAHVLGSCPHGEDLRNARHHQVRSIIATALKDADYNTFEEVHGLSVTGTASRREQAANITAQLMFKTQRLQAAPAGWAIVTTSDAISYPSGEKIWRKREIGLERATEK
ncbi:hypothetical protein ANN_02000 [Periplaneta americana]|uniref:Reverse transcriptase n=1 Tax=Periplaneta americana TaxID=6978 RepID=A0ABQ8TXJ9_PERAM|nr:hypothetical protein ANN_02000 [Periplaneta americana]